MKKYLSTIGVTLLALALLFTFTAVQPIHVHTSNEIAVTIDGVSIDFEGQPPANIDGRILVPVRGVFEALGFDVDFDFSTDTQQVFLVRGTDSLVITIGSAIFTSNGARHNLDVPAQIIEGRTLLPIRAVLESVGYEVDWANNTVIITSPMHTDVPRFVRAVFDLVNAERVRYGLNVLAWDEGLANIAQSRIDAGRSVTTAADLAIGRNTSWALNNTTPQIFVENFMNSEAQRLQLINPAATRLGVGFAMLPPHEGQRNPRPHLQLFFGTPTEVAANANPLLIQNMIDAGTYPMSQITLPINRQANQAERAAWVAEYHAMGGVTEFEREVVRLLNIERAALGLAPVQFCYTLAMAARYYTQLIIHIGYTTGGNVAGTAHNQGPYGGSGATARSFGGTSTGGNAFVPGPNTPEALIAGWMNSAGHRNNMLNPSRRFAGFGMSICPETGRGFSYFFLSNTQSTPNN